jgi:hypothetical protein
MVTVEAQLVWNGALLLSTRSAPHKDPTGAGR